MAAGLITFSMWAGLAPGIGANLSFQMGSGELDGCWMNVGAGKHMGNPPNPFDILT